MSEPLFCVNCVHFERPKHNNDMSLARCGALFVENKALSLVTGRPEGTATYCETARSKDGKCGPEGKLFRPVPPLMEGA